MAEPRSRVRMTGKERREQLIRISRTLFAEKGFDATSIEEIAASAKVSKPVVYEHFGGKEGLYAVVVDREMERLLALVSGSMNAGHPKVRLERAAIALLQYIEESHEGFRILVRDSQGAQGASGTGTFASLINDIASQVEYVLADQFSDRGYEPTLAPMYAQMLVGMVAVTGQWWLDARTPGREEVAAHLVNLAWNGLNGLDPHPTLTAAATRAAATPAAPSAEPRVPAPRFSEKRIKELEKARDKEFRELEKLREKELKEQEKVRERELKEQEKVRERELKEQEKELREQEKVRAREQREHEKLLREQEKARARDEREQEKLLREQEKARAQEQRDREKALREQEKQRAHDAKMAERQPHVSDEALHHGLAVPE
ncbi:TetR/AcrR family transcriptional regulator [Sphaerisporangium sp. TRM90804]|uniref:TetR/AcrR family transcriptional regulator n=1 Tax=Sphaerisporangium sp. TRM90804 TaxID=3031113 RepID=UPI0024478D89|nr:TetR/AcrR family transcriptional regulator [Sphaerisporangium sp. TRM90804]MDH2428728.1 TetR family transcriptional regulator [Sphaerisporangium sp. TRM90804]